MKYLKKYENYKEYKVDDYILTNIHYSDAYNLEPEEMPGKILKINLSSYFPYIVVFDDGTTEAIQKSNIIRFLTQDEIEEYETKIQSIKYNL